ncbi:hypothetical protein VU08_06550 [Desulfobulbus sp. F5]|nr:hypothetical protein [Desulfobulbus sp. F5]
MNKRRSISCALIILSALLFGPANALALSDLDTKFRGVKTDEQGQERHLYCDLLTITNGTLICRIGNLDDRIPLSHVKQLDVEYMGKRYVVSNINKSDIDSANAMSVKKEEAFYRQEKANQERVSNSESQSYLFGTIDSSATPNDNDFAAIAKEPEASQREMFRKNIDKIIDADISAHGGVNPLDRMQLPDNKEAKGGWFKGWFGPSNFDECILDRMPGVKNDTVASETREICRKEFPNQREVKKKSAIIGIKNSSECVLKYAKDETSPLSARLIKTSCYKLYPKE